MDYKELMDTFAVDVGMKEAIVYYDGPMDFHLFAIAARSESVARPGLLSVFDV